MHQHHTIEVPQGNMTLFHLTELLRGVQPAGGFIILGEVNPQSDAVELDFPGATADQVNQIGQILNAEMH